MSQFVISLSFASALTAIFAFRYSTSRRPLLLATYFSVFLAIEWAAETWVLPSDALPIEVAYACFGIATLFVVASAVRDRFTHESTDRS